MIKIYLDVCCLNRPFDDQSQDRIHLEAEAVLLILKHVESGDWEWVGSNVMAYEIAQTPDSERRNRVNQLAAYAPETVRVGPDEVRRGQELEKSGFQSMDALHIACAESGNANTFLTTDDRLLRQALRLKKQLRVRVENPLDWLKRMVNE
jgi:predicted nucleic acid-binding protein